jgi:uncharacterized protein YdaU (DUF1376 family)
MAEFPALPLWTDAYLGDTRHLTTTEHGAYMLLLMIAWRSRDCALPDDDALLARYAGLPRGKWAKMAPTIRAFFEARGGQLFQPRLTDERDAVQTKRDAQIANGRASALKRKKRHLTKRIASDEPKSNGASTPLPFPLGSNEPIEEPKGSIVKSELLPEHVVEIWNTRAEGWGVRPIRKLTPERKQLLKARIRENSIEDFIAVFDAIDRSAFLRGESSSGWRVGFDFVFKKGNFVKIQEGSYDH